MGKKTRSTPPQWSELPPEILQIIGELTGTPIYQTQFRAVCKPWRSALGIVENRGMKNFPLKIPYHILLGCESRRGNADNRDSLFVVLTTSYVIEPIKSSSFLVTVDEINPGFLSPRYPLSKSNCGAWGLGNQVKGLDLLENRVRALDSGFSIRLLDVRGNASEKDGRVNELRHGWCGDFRRVIVLRNPSCEDDLFIVVLLFFKLLITLRVREGKWKVVVDGKLSKCAEDVVKFKEQIYGIDDQGGAFRIDYDYQSGNTNIVAVAPALDDDGVPRSNRLVVDSCHDRRRLYMVVQMISSSGFAFSVYGLNEDEGVWEKVCNIGNRMFFVGENFSFCATSQDFPGLSMSCMRSLPQNCIFFTTRSFAGHTHEANDGDRLLFGIKTLGNNGTSIGQYYLGDKCATGILEPALVTMFSPQT